MSVLFYLGILILGSMLMGKVVRLAKLPNVTGYLLCGLLFGPYVLGVIPYEMVEECKLIGEMALAFIAFSIGTEFKISYFKKVGTAPIVIAVFEGVLAMVCVFAVLMAFGFSLEVSLVLGAIASATAPAATVMVINQYKAKGVLTSTLLSVVAIDDAIALVCFGFAVAIVNSMTGGAFQLADLLSPLYEVGISLVLGGVLGFIFVLPFKIFKKQSSFLCLAIAFVFIANSLATLAHGSSLLTCMAMGGVYINLHRKGEKVVSTLGGITPPIYMLFFALSGAELDWRILPSIGLIGILYVVARVVGKICGAGVGCILTKQEPKVTKNLGLALVPQAGVALGLSMMASTLLPEYGAMIRTVVLCGTFIYEMIGPVFAKMALKNAGEIKEPARVEKKTT